MTHVAGRNETSMGSKRNSVSARTLQPGDKVKFVGDHPWRGEIGSYQEVRQTPVGLMHIFVVLDKAGITAGAFPNQFERV